LREGGRELCYKETLELKLEEGEIQITWVPTCLGLVRGGRGGGRDPSI